MLFRASFDEILLLKFRIDFKIFVSSNFSIPGTCTVMASNPKQRKIIGYFTAAPPRAQPSSVTTVVRDRASTDADDGHTHTDSTISSLNEQCSSTTSGEGNNYKQLAVIFIPIISQETMHF